MKDKIINNFSKQHYKFDCWAKSIENTLKIIKKELIIDYKILLKELKTTTLWWTFPEKIEDFLIKNNISYNKNINLISKNTINIFLINWYNFYNDNVDYWHYFITIKQDNLNHFVYDVWDWKTHIINETELINLTKNVLVWKTKRYNDICFSFNIN